MPIHLKNITMQFIGTRALDDISLSFQEGEVHSIVGENGAGKSTLLGVLSGTLRPTSGEILVGDQRVSFQDPAAGLANGIALVSQEGSLVPHLSAAENIMLGREPHLMGVVQGRRLQAQAQELMQRWFSQCTIDLSAEVQTLPFADQKMIEIMRALNSAAKILILDEPTAALPAREKAQLWQVIRDLAARGVGIVYVSHLLSEVIALSDRMSVLRDGKLVAQTVPAECDEARLVNLMLGRSGNTTAQTQRARADLSDNATVLQVQNWKGQGYDVDSFSVRAGEVVGLVGLTHAGHHEFARSLYEVPLRRSGSLQIDGRNSAARRTRDSLGEGIALVPDHRMVNSLIAGWSVRENLSLAHARRMEIGSTGLLSRSRERACAQDSVQRMRVKTHSIHQAVDELSGGNKQKISVGKWLFADAKTPTYRVMVFIEPTEGVDVGAKAEIHRLILELAQAGLGIVVVSSDLLEVQSLSDRLLVFRQGRACDELHAEQFTERHLIEAMAGEVTNERSTPNE